MNSALRPLAVVTGASSGIGLELAREAAQAGFDLVLAADREFDQATLSGLGNQVETVQADLATVKGVDKLIDTLKGRQVDALLANAGHGLGKGFLDQDFAEITHVIDTNITGTLYLIHKV